MLDRKSQKNFERALLHEIEKNKDCSTPVAQQQY